MAQAPRLMPQDVTILKPLYGAEPLLPESLTSYCNQNYHAEIQIVFGFQDSVDPAISCVQSLIAAHPGSDLELVVDATQHGANRKVSNLINMGGAAKHEIVVLADSDILVAPDYLGRTIASLQAPGVGAVTCLYRGVPVGGVWSTLSAMAIDLHFLPSVIVGKSLGRANPCFGSTIALRRETLSRIGGLSAFADCLADDYAIGEAVRAAGLEVAIPPFVVGHVCPETSLAALLRHELRWARTIRLVDPAGFAGLIMTHALPMAMIGVIVDGFGPAGLAVLASALASRIWLQLVVDRAIGADRGRTLLVPVRDLLSFGVFVAAWFVAAIDWRGHRYGVDRDGILRVETPHGVR